MVPESRLDGHFREASESALSAQRGVRALRRGAFIHIFDREISKGIRRVLIITYYTLLFIYIYIIITYYNSFFSLLLTTFIKFRKQKIESNPINIKTFCVRVFYFLFSYSILLLILLINCIIIATL